MALTTNPSNLGQANLSGSDLALFLKMFSGEVLTTFERMNVMEPLISHYTIGSGKTFQFPAIGEAEAVHHVKGESIYDETKNYLNNIEHAERTINVDRPLISSVFIDNWDDLINHYDVRSTYAAELGKALARKKDRYLMRTLANTAAKAATLTATQPLKTGKVTTTAAMDVNMTTLRGAILEAMTVLVQKDVPMSELVCLLRPAQFYPLMDTGYFLNADFNNANGTLAQGTFDKAYGFRIVMTNNMPQEALGSVAGELNAYNGDFTNLVSLCFHKDAIGAVRRQGVMMESEYSVDRQGTLMVAKMIEGYGTLRPECAVALYKS